MNNSTYSSLNAIGNSYATSSYGMSGMSKQSYMAPPPPMYNTICRSSAPQVQMKCANIDRYEQL